ncbi:integrase core domain-containing protein [Mycobacterium sp. JS623]|uniref:integrase core domain-containing protein n=1 Tax=Mycobacterium sp. JS623 TaxID=212767 RepID=UPI000A06754B|nr:integrase core domain-containing protein [Mycobacterium sp. JS623]
MPTSHDHKTTHLPRALNAPRLDKHRSIERFHQTLKKHLSTLPRAATLAELQTQIDDFLDEYGHHRPHCSLPHRATPATAYSARPKATPGERFDSHHRVRTDRVDDTGSITLRLAGRLHHIGVGRSHARTHVLMLVRDLDIRIINAATGDLIRELTLDPTRDYQPRGVPCGRPKKKL